MRIEAVGSIDAAGMRSMVDNPLTRRLAGRTDYRASIDVDRRASTLRIESDLVGLSSTLPAPFAKAAGDAWPLRVTSRPLAPPGPTAPCRWWWARRSRPRPCASRRATANR